MTSAADARRRRDSSPSRGRVSGTRGAVDMPSAGLVRDTGEVAGQDLLQVPQRGIPGRRPGPQNLVAKAGTPTDSAPTSGRSRLASARQTCSRPAAATEEPSEHPLAQPTDAAARAASIRRPPATLPGPRLRRDRHQQQHTRTRRRRRQSVRRRRWVSPGWSDSSTAGRADPPLPRKPAGARAASRATDRHPRFLTQHRWILH